MPANYTLKLSLRQANIVRDALVAYKKQTHETVQKMSPSDGQSLRALIGEIAQLQEQL